MAVVYASYSLRTGEAIKESVVRESMELAVDERVEDCESMATPNGFCLLAFLKTNPSSTLEPSLVSRNN